MRSMMYAGWVAEHLPFLYELRVWLGDRPSCSGNIAVHVPIGHWGRVGCRLFVGLSGQLVIWNVDVLEGPDASSDDGNVGVAGPRHA